MLEYSSDPPKFSIVHSKQNPNSTIFSAYKQKAPDFSTIIHSAFQHNIKKIKESISYIVSRVCKLQGCGEQEVENDGHLEGFLDLDHDSQSLVRLVCFLELDRDSWRSLAHSLFTDELGGNILRLLLEQIDRLRRSEERGKEVYIGGHKKLLFIIIFFWKKKK